MTDVLDTNLTGSEEVRARFRQDVCQRCSETGHLGPSWLGSGWFRIRQSSQAITGNTSDIRPADAGRIFFGGLVSERIGKERTCRTSITAGMIGA